MSTNIAERTHLVWTSSGTCGCGFDPTVVTPTEAVTTLRSLARRWRSALAFDLDSAEPEDVLTHRPMGGWSALEHAGHVRDVLHALSIRLQRVLREDDPVLPETHVTPPSGANEQGPGVVLAALSLTADTLAETIEMTAPTEWHRTGRRGRDHISAIELVREAVHEGVHHLQEASAQIEDLRLTDAL